MSPPSDGPHPIASVSDDPAAASLDRLVRGVSIAFAATSFPLAAVLLVDPEFFWSRFQVGGSPFVEALYGGAIGGEGVMFALAARRPTRYRVFFEYMTVYKTLAVLAGAFVLASSTTPPSGGASILFGWGVAGAISAYIVTRSARAPS